jgi:hypothetical protein
MTGLFANPATCSRLICTTVVSVGVICYIHIQGTVFMLYLLACHVLHVAVSLPMSKFGIPWAKSAAGVLRHFLLDCLLACLLA